MKVEKITSVAATPPSPSIRPAPSAAPSDQPVPPVPPVAPADSVQISHAARARVMRFPPVKAPAEPLTLEHLAEIQRRIATGSYDAADIIELVAGRIMADGALRTPAPALPAPEADAEAGAAQTDAD